MDQGPSRSTLALHRPGGNGTRREGIPQPLRYLAVSGSGAAVNFATFAALRASAIPTIACGALAFAAACRHGLTWHARITFRLGNPSPRRRGPRFVLLSLATLGVNLAALSTLEGIGVTSLLAQVVAVGVTCPLNFLGSRFWVFRHEPVRRDAGRA